VGISSIRNPNPTSSSNRGHNSASGIVIEGWSARRFSTTRVSGSLAPFRFSRGPESKNGKGSEQAKAAQDCSAERTEAQKVEAESLQESYNRVFLACNASEGGS
jgi:hypothetical protein